MTLEQKVAEAINQIRPSLQNDGGDIEFIKLDNKDVYVLSDVTDDTQERC